MLLAINCPSQLRILPLFGFTLTLSRLSRAATSVQYSFSAVMIYPAFTTTDMPIIVNTNAISR